MCGHSAEIWTMGDPLATYTHALSGMYGIEARMIFNDGCAPPTRTDRMGAGAAIGGAEATLPTAL